MRMSLKHQEERAKRISVVGTPIIITNANGFRRESKTRSEPWLMSGHSWMVMVEGISGAYCVSHVEPMGASK